MTIRNDAFKYAQNMSRLLFWSYNIQQIRQLNTTESWMTSISALDQKKRAPSRQILYRFQSSPSKG